MGKTREIDLKLDELAKQCPLEGRLLNIFWMQWMDDNIKEERCHTEEEDDKAIEWANKMTKKTLSVVKQWQEDGSPQ